MHRSFRAGTLLRKILRLWLRMTSEGCGSYFIAIIMCFHTTINERPPLSSARRSRRSSCTGLPCRNSSARDPSPLAQDDMSGVRRLFHNNDGFGGLVPWDGGTVETHAVGRGLAPAAHFPEPGHPLHMHRTPKSVIANQRARWCGNPFPCKPQGLRAPAGAQYRPEPMTGLTAGAMLPHCGGRIATSPRSPQSSCVFTPP